MLKINGCSGLSPKWDIYFTISLAQHSRKHLGKGNGNNLRAGELGGVLGNMVISTWHGHGFMKSLKLLVFAQDSHKIKLVSARIRKGKRKHHPELWGNWQLMAAGAKRFISLGVSPMLNCPCFGIWPHIPVCAAIVTALSRRKNKKRTWRRGRNGGWIWSTYIVHMYENFKE